MVHDPQGSREHDIPELTRGQKVAGPLLDLRKLEVEPGRDNPALVDAPNEVDHDLAGAVVVDDLELPNVACGLQA